MSTPEFEFDEDVVKKLRDQPSARDQPRMSRAEFVASLMAAPRALGELIDSDDIATPEEWGPVG